MYIIIIRQLIPHTLPLNKLRETSEARFLFGGGRCKSELQALVRDVLVVSTLQFTHESPTIFHGLPIMYEPFQIHKETHLEKNKRELE